LLRGGADVILDDLLDYLSTSGMGTVGSTADGSLFYSQLPPEVIACIGLFETGGLSSIHTFSGGPGNAVVERPRVQVVSRAATYATARARAQDAFMLLDGLANRTINGVRYLSITAVQSPFDMGRDDNNYPRVACNFDVVKSLSTSTST
jgi:hypothetical protein